MVSHLLVHLGWVDLDFECSRVCQILPGLMGIRQKWRGSWARWWNTQIKVSPTQVHEQMGHPVQDREIQKRYQVAQQNSSVCIDRKED